MLFWTEASSFALTCLLLSRWRSWTITKCSKSWSKSMLFNLSSTGRLVSLKLKLSYLLYALGKWKIHTFCEHTLNVNLECMQVEHVMCGMRQFEATALAVHTKPRLGLDRMALLVVLIADLQWNVWFASNVPLSNLWFYEVDRMLINIKKHK